MRLSELKPGETGVITKILGHGAFRKRVIEMGFVRGREVKVLLHAPLQDPIKYTLMDYEVSLRRSESELIEIVSINEWDKSNFRNDSIKNKEISLEKNINLIYGKNESGKSTILKFIYCMLFGASKNKNGKEISDFEKYKPWNSEEFSGKLNYILDTGEKFEVFREFSKKNPKIYNSNLEEISKQFNIDKNNGTQFFYDQTKIDESLFLSTNIVEQQEVVLDNNNQNILTQKIANILSAGEDNVSYKKVMSNLSKRLIEEVGTERTVGRPLNEVEEKLKELRSAKKELENFNTINKEIKENKKEIENDLKNIEDEINLIKEIKNIKDDEKIKKEKININEEIKKEYEEKIINLKNKIRNTENIKEKNNKKNKINLAIISILAFINILISFINLSAIAERIIVYSFIIYLILNIIIYLINKYKNKKTNKIKNIEKIKLEKEIEILEENKNSKEKEIINIKNRIIEKNNEQLKILNNKFNKNFNEEEIINLFNCDLKEIIKQIDELNKTYNSKRIELNTISIKENEINYKIENKIESEEQLKYYEEQKQELLDLEESINIAKETLEEAYNEMKNEITPKFTKDLSLLIEEISNGKYKKTNFDAEYGLRVERENGEYIDCNRLSVGTIDQLYLSLRLSAMNEISQEKMPIILDESFAYYDNERLENILKFINNNYKENQILIFTCSNREKEIMDRLNIEYNFVEL